MRKILYLLGLMLMPSLVYAQGFHVQDIVLLNQGGYAKPAPGTITVCTSTATINPSTKVCAPTVTIYSNITLATVKANPFKADANGNFDFYVPSGTYLYTVTGVSGAAQSHIITAPCTIDSAITTCVPGHPGASPGSPNLSVQYNNGGNFGGGPPVGQVYLKASTVAYSATPDFVMTGNDLFEITLTGNVTAPTLTNTPLNGYIENFNIIQDSVGKHTFTWPAAMLTPPAINTARGTNSYCSFVYNGTNFIGGCKDTSSERSGAIRYAAPWGKDTNDGLTAATAFLTVSHALCSLPNGGCNLAGGGGFPAGNYEGSGTVEVFSGAQANSVSCAGVWLLDLHDPNYINNTVPAGWTIFESDANVNGISGTTIIGIGNDVLSSNAQENATALHGGCGADTNHPLFWFAGGNGYTVKNIVAADSIGQFIKVGVYSDGSTTYMGHNVSVADLHFDNLQWTLHQTGSNGPGIFLGDGIFNDFFTNTVGSGDPTSTNISKQACLLISPVLQPSGLNQFDNGVCNGGGYVIGANTGVANFHQILTESQNSSPTPTAAIHLLACGLGCFLRADDIYVADNAGVVPAVWNEGTASGLVRTSSLLGGGCDMKGPMIYEVNYPGQQNCTYNDPSLDNEYGAGFNNSSGIGYTGSFQSLVSQYSARIGDQLDFLNIFTNKHNYFSPIPFTSVLHSTFLPESSGAICLTTSCDTTQVSDFFDRANGTVGSNYTAMPGLTLPNITSDLVQGSGVTDYQAYYSGQPWPSGTSQTVEITVGTGQTSCSSTANYYNIIGIFKQAAADSEYALLCFNNTFLLNKVVAGSSNFLSSIAGDLSAGDKLLLNGVVSGGSTILTWWKFASLTQTWTQIDTKTDSSTPFQNGYPVFGLKGTTDYISNFSAWATGAPLQVSGITVTPGGTITGTTSYVELNVFDFATDITVGDGAYYFVVPAGFNGKSVVSLSAQDVTAGVTGTTNIQIAKCSPVATGNMCSGTVVDILSTAETIDSGENKTSTAATPAVINGANAGLLTDDVLRIDIDATSTTKGKGLIQGLGIQ